MIIKKKFSYVLAFSILLSSMSPIFLHANNSISVNSNTSSNSLFSKAATLAVLSKVYENSAFAAWRFLSGAAFSAGITAGIIALIYVLYKKCGGDDYVSGKNGNVIDTAKNKINESKSDATKQKIENLKTPKELLTDFINELTSDETKQKIEGLKKPVTKIITEALDGSLETLSKDINTSRIKIISAPLKELADKLVDKATKKLETLIEKNVFVRNASKVANIPSYVVNIPSRFMGIFSRKKKEKVKPNFKFIDDLDQIPSIEKKKVEVKKELIEDKEQRVEAKKERLKLQLKEENKTEKKSKKIDLLKKKNN